MDNQRLILFLALSLASLLLWDAWQRDHAPIPPAPQANVPNNEPLIQGAPPPSNRDVPSEATAKLAPAPVVNMQGTTPKDVIGASLKAGQRIRVTTDVFDIELDATGGDVRVAKLARYPIDPNTPEKFFALLNDKKEPLFVAQSGLLSNGGIAPDHYATFVAEQSEYTLAPGVDELKVPLRWTGSDGVTVTKTYTFYRGEYTIDVEQAVTNNSSGVWSGRQYRQLQRSSQATKGESAFIYTYTGGVIYSPEEKYEKIKFDDMADEDLGRSIEGGWAAIIQHYFVGAWVPSPEENNFYYSKAPGEDRYVLGLVSPEEAAAPGETITFSSRLFIGPKLQDTMEKLAPGLELTVDYGFLTIIAKPLFWLLQTIHSFVGNWGWSIALVTLCIKLVFFPLSAASYKSMANMRRLQPKIMALRERYGDDKQRMSQGMMELYKKEKINPFGGCLPILVQIPVFISLYWVLLESVELRQAPFILWLTDLSTKDPYYVLPVLMGASMLLQQKLQPPPPDPVQAKVMMALPFIFTLFFAFFPSGLVLYWVVNNVLSIGQQWYITRKVEKAAAVAKTS